MAKIDDQDQLGIDEKHVDDPAVEQALEERELARQGKSAATLTFRQAHDRAKDLIERLELPEEDGAVVRVGRFRISRRLVKGGARSFETNDRIQLSIGLVDAGEGGAE
jgi:hypothetical protein